MGRKRTCCKHLFTGKSCKECSRERARAWYYTHKEYISNKQKEERALFGDAVRERESIRSKTEKFKQTRKRYRKANPEKVKAIKQRGYQKNKEKILASIKRYREENADLVKERTKRWRKENPDRIRQIQNLHDMRRRGKIAGVLCTLTQEQWEAILELYEHRCAYCGIAEKLEKEHVMPLSKGGHTVSENIVPACRSCNASKNNKLLKEWLN